MFRFAVSHLDIWTAYLSWNRYYKRKTLLQWLPNASWDYSFVIIWRQFSCLNILFSIESLWTFIFEICYFIPARVVKPCFKDFLEEGRTTYLFRTLFYFWYFLLIIIEILTILKSIPLALLIISWPSDGLNMVEHIGSCSMLILSGKKKT